MKRHVILVGLSGSGKSRAGALAAQYLGTRCVDVDGTIESSNGRTITEIFEQDGEAAFRALERAGVQSALRGPPCVVVPGGGWAAQPGNLALVSKNVFIIYLNTSPAVASRRLASASDRPLLGATPEADLTRQLEVREPFYLKADAVVETDGLAIENVVDKLVELARESAGW